MLYNTACKSWLQDGDPWLDFVVLRLVKSGETRLLDPNVCVDISGGRLHSMSWDLAYMLILDLPFFFTYVQKKIHFPETAVVSITADGIEIAFNANALQNYLIGNNPAMISVINGRSERTFTRNPDGTYNCDQSLYREQVGVGLGRHGECGRGISKDEVVASVREFIPAAGGKRRRSTRRRSTRRN